jgi:hypothetical protein
MKFYNNWTFYFHDSNNKNWDDESYIKLCEINNIIDFWTVYDIIKNKLYLGMFFFMKNDISPKWEDNNISILSIKVLKNNVEYCTEYLLTRLLGENILKNETDKINSIVGLSVSPKKTFCIFKIWIKDSEINSADSFDLPNIYHGEPLFRD